MRILGIGSNVNEAEGAKPVDTSPNQFKPPMMIQVPLSSYSQNDILEAFRKKIKEKVVTKKHTAAMQDVHESYQVTTKISTQNPAPPDCDESEGIKEEILNNWKRSCATREIYNLHEPGLLVLS